MRKQRLPRTYARTHWWSLVGEAAPLKIELLDNLQIKRSSPVINKAPLLENTQSATNYWRLGLGLFPSLV